MRHCAGIVRDLVFQRLHLLGLFFLIFPLTRWCEANQKENNSIDVWSQQQQQQQSESYPPSAFSVNTANIGTHGEVLIPDEQRLLQEILRDYDPASRPTYIASKSVNVGFQMTLIQISQLVSQLKMVLKKQVGSSI